VNAPQKYPDTYDVEVLKKVMATPCRNRRHKTAVEFNRLFGYDTVVLCADCLAEETELREKAKAAGA
jgi:hypothetical protein